MSPFFSKAFGFDPSKHNVRTEIIAGLTTFLTMAYILPRSSPPQRWPPS